MEITTKGTIALKRLRQELQEDAGDDFPQAVLPQLLMLRDVCKNLDLNVFQAIEVLGESGWRGVTQYINSPACETINWKQVNQLCGELALP